ncbi:MAG: 30S ribosomal protein S18 [Candidatus Uhrbacteria bacterium GW2011_GWE2_45_35]|uniref:Small ribosomal subunit protein bS18 n=2 Tax=Candidatus Uhriibacteriota TaxID=1752732 RepID=A0A0G1JFA6_9BACT|nr:MAG: 30S ribosomal protein S18 [Candidatus Uhrbacteria bacterium GW2011_GWF2_44_350]KKU06809.1 MAG: 30S ribosomal protein S18 [Candidatus Uhrbacteria bacterium GW2011_GWE2_45_35]HBR80403.1 30S ribosomal protein S18 [Candidatus Uhrbacteria bacterium]HCU32028.1 30S ribosomal protein S18 [Candidatus Uhrbacteria bacterium]
MKKSNNKNTQPKQRHCSFCVNKKIEIDYKDSGFLRRFTSSFAKIVPRHRSGVCAKHQRELATAIKRARVMALLPFVQK